MVTSAAEKELAPVVLTESAAAKVKELMREEASEPSMLRVYIQGGGCSGFEYGFEFQDEANEDDTVIDNAGVKVLIDPLSFQYLVGAAIDYVEDLQGARFIVSNPNATTTCGCGSSFAT